MSEEVKRINIKEFREEGYLQELNRRFLHPLGLALEIIIDETGEEKLGGVWDYRDDPEGLNYGLNNPTFSSEERLEGFRKRCKNITDQELKKREVREKNLGYFIEPIPDKNEG